LRAPYAGHPIQPFVSASNREEAQVNVRYRVALSQSERGELTAFLSGGKHAARKLKHEQILLAAVGVGTDMNLYRFKGPSGPLQVVTKVRHGCANGGGVISLDEPDKAMRQAE
jgi:hypothetical protein